MKEHSRATYWALLVMCMVFVIVGVFQLGYIVGVAVNSTEFGFEQVGLLRLGLIASAIFGASMLIQTLKGK